MDVEQLVLSGGTAAVVWSVLQFVLRWISQRKWDIVITPESVRELVAERDRLRAELAAEREKNATQK